MTLVVGSPTVSISWYALLFAVLAPLAWPAVAGSPAETRDPRRHDLGSGAELVSEEPLPPLIPRAIGPLRD